MAEDFKSRVEIKEEAAILFREYFQAEPSVWCFAPGRINVIGEHTDYNDGFALPMAIPMVTVVVGRKNGTNKCKLYTTCEELPSQEREVVVEVPPQGVEVPRGKPRWSNYVRGVIHHFPSEAVIPGFDAVIMSTLPTGAGLSSSASLEVAVFSFIEALIPNVTPELQIKAEACRSAEVEYADVPCGIMDQYASVMGLEDQGMLIDCRSGVVNMVGINSERIQFLIIDSGVKRELVNTSYSKRRDECEQACKALGLESLRDATLSLLDEAKDNMSEELYRRARHVISENQRTITCAKALSKSDFNTAGLAMIQSHYSLRDDFEVSCPELDQIVEIAMSCDGVYGARMTGAGFGGCAIALLKKEVSGSVVETLKEEFTGADLKIYVVAPSSGCRYYTVL